MVFNDLSSLVHISLPYSSIKLNSKRSRSDRSQRHRVPGSNVEKYGITLVFESTIECTCQRKILECICSSVSSSLASGGKILKTSIMAKSLDSDTLYVYIDSGLWNFSKAHHNKDDILGILDDVLLLAPNLLPCGRCDLVGIEIR